MGRHRDSHSSRRQDEKLAVALASSCRTSRIRRGGGGGGRRGIGALAVPAMLFLLALMVLAGLLREFVAF